MKTMQFDFNNIRSVHLEITDKCNARCPMCARLDPSGRVREFVGKNEMNLNLAKNIFYPDFLMQLNFIQLCGNFGDPIVAQDTLEILKYFRSINPSIHLGIHTNGSARTQPWWEELGKLLSGAGDYCKFGLDGLSDTNHIYRRNTQWEKIMNSVRAFISAGGNAHWEYLVFRHNEHQIEEAKLLSEKMGFKEFYIKKTSRFFNYKTGENDNFPIYDHNNDLIGFLEPPTEKRLVNKISQETSVFDKGYIYKNEIDCSAIREKQVYISCQGEIFPCCFLGGELYYGAGSDESKLIREKFSSSTSQMENLIPKEGVKVQDIIEGAYFKFIENEFKEKDSIVKTCSRFCTSTKKIVEAEYQ